MIGCMLECPNDKMQGFQLMFQPKIPQHFVVACDLDLSSMGPKTGPPQTVLRQEGFSETSQNTYFERILSAARRGQTLGGWGWLSKCSHLTHHRHRLAV